MLQIARAANKQQTSNHTPLYVTHVRLGRAGRQRTTTAGRSSKSACPLSLMNLLWGAPLLREGGKGEAPGVRVSPSTRFGTHSNRPEQPGHRAASQSSRSPRQTTHLFPRVNYSFPLLPRLPFIAEEIENKREKSGESLSARARKREAR